MVSFILFCGSAFLRLCAFLLFRFCFSASTLFCFYAEATNDQRATNKLGGLVLLVLNANNVTRSNVNNEQRR
ncbi:hypothetical protein F5879DRAFT_962082 [Lentinula edodes]|nr:hypothetical protein F5879DRAFT_962082 [Lentinula edodes]